MVFPICLNILEISLPVLLNILLIKILYGVIASAILLTTFFLNHTLALNISFAIKFLIGFTTSALIRLPILSTKPPLTKACFFSSHLPNNASLNLLEAIPNPIAPPVIAAAYGPIANGPRIPPNAKLAPAPSTAPVTA